MFQGGGGGAQNYELAKEQLFFNNFSLQIRKFSNIMNMIVWIFMNLDLKLCANAYVCISILRSSGGIIYMYLTKSDC